MGSAGAGETRKKGRIQLDPQMNEKKNVLLLRIRSGVGGGNRQSGGITDRHKKKKNSRTRNPNDFTFQHELGWKCPLRF